MTDEATTLADATAEATSGPPNAQDGAIQSLGEPWRGIWLEEKADALESWVAWVASFPGCPYAASARAVLREWGSR